MHTGAIVDTIFARIGCYVLKEDLFIEKDCTNHVITLYFPYIYVYIYISRNKVT